MASRGTTNNNNSAVFFSLWNSEGAWKFLLREADGQWLSGAPPTTATPQFFLFWNSEGAWKFLLREAEGKWPPGQGGKVQREGAKTQNKNEE